MVPAVWWFMFKSHWGLELRAVGEKPRAVDTVGVSVTKTRFMAVIFSGFLAGLGGAVLSLQQVNTFTENMTSGRGWLALISAISGGWNPFGAAAASFIFGVANSLQLRIQVMDIKISSWIVLMVPYLLAIMSGFHRGQSCAPSRSHRRTVCKGINKRRLIFDKTYFQYQ